MRNRLRYIDAPGDLIDKITLALDGQIRKAGRKDSLPGVYEFKLLGSPWKASGEKTMDTRRLLLLLLEVLEEYGFTVYASIDQKIGAEGRDLDTWHCCRPKAWQRGMPVFHS